MGFRVIENTASSPAALIASIFPVDGVSPARHLLSDVQI